jgi:aminoglycoside 6'-N-acetyltransferase I
MTTELRRLTLSNIEEIEDFFLSVFTKEPWNDDWSDKAQLHAYITDLVGNHNSLALGLFENGNMVGLAMGSIRHWYSGTEYYIDEFCIKTEEQGRGLGTQFLRVVETFLSDMEINHIFLQTERTVPAYGFYIKNGFRELENHVSLIKQCEKDHSFNSIN